MTPKSTTIQEVRGVNSDGGPLPAAHGSRNGWASWRMNVIAESTRAAETTVSSFAVVSARSQAARNGADNITPPAIASTRGSGLSNSLRPTGRGEASTT